MAMDHKQAQAFIATEVKRRKDAGEDFDGNAAMEVMEKLGDNWANYPGDAYRLIYNNNVETADIDTMVNEALLDVVMKLAQE